jgi:hypothetical protein
MVASQLYRSHPTLKKEYQIGLGSRNFQPIDFRKMSVVSLLSHLSDFPHDSCNQSIPNWNAVLSRKPHPSNRENLVSGSFTHLSEARKSDIKRSAKLVDRGFRTLVVIAK